MSNTSILGAAKLWKRHQKALCHNIKLCTTAEDVDPGGWSGWQEIEVEPPELPAEEPVLSDISDSDEDMAGMLHVICSLSPCKCSRTQHVFLQISSCIKLRRLDCATSLMFPPHQIQTAHQYTPYFDILLTCFIPTQSDAVPLSEAVHSSLRASSQHTS